MRCVSYYWGYYKLINGKPVPVTCLRISNIKKMIKEIMSSWKIYCERFTKLSLQKSFSIYFISVKLQTGNLEIDIVRDF